MTSTLRIAFLFVCGMESCLCVLASQPRQTAAVEEFVLNDTWEDIRNADPREWTTFPQDSPREFQQNFESRTNETVWTLRLVQTNVRESWKILLNETELGELYRDENSIVGYWSVPAGVVRDGANTLKIASSSRRPDDVRLGQVVLLSSPRDAALNYARIRVAVHEAGQTVPCRLTVLRDGALMSVAAESNETMAVRPGVIYCTGEAEFGLPAGRYTIIAGRGPEYSIARASVDVAAGRSLSLQLDLDRVVDTTGLVACDTHVHTLTHSGHGDASISERMLTLAGEGVELAIATDHNKHIDYAPISHRMQMSSFFTTVIGNEVTTPRGHFNIFPVEDASTPVPNYRTESWEELAAGIRSTPDARVVILNHAQDLHSGFRPFDPEHHIPVTGRNLHGHQLPANAMEIINSAAQQSDMMSLVRNWMAMLNAGHLLTPVGSSDSHDVARHFVGQGRTYIRCDDADVSAIPVDRAVDQFLRGAVTVSCGLIADLRINADYGPGDIVPAASQYQIEVDAKGAEWVTASTVEIYVNGRLHSRHTIPRESMTRAGLKHTVSMELDGLPDNDVFVSAVVRGPGVKELFWPIARPYQSRSPDWTPECMAVTGAVWLDLDGDGQRSCAAEYARTVCADISDTERIFSVLQKYDYAVALHAAEILRERDPGVFQETFLIPARRQEAHIAEAFTDYRDAWRDSQLARSAQ